MRDLPQIRAHETALFLDFDGTLVEIAPRPEDVLLAPGTRDALARLSRALGGAVALVSGRALADLDRHLAPLVLPAAGAHGAERRDARGSFHMAEEAVEGLGPVIAALEAFAAQEGLLVERKPGGISLHYRDRPEMAEDVRGLVDDIAGGSAALRVIHGKMVAEVAAAQCDKGRALSSFLAEPPFAGRLPLAIGDDTTDEDLFAAALAAGGTAIKIGTGSSVAPHRMASTGAFLEWLGAEAARLAPAEEV